MSSILGIIASSMKGVAPGAYESIATYTPTGTTSVTFNSIPSTYKHLQIRAKISNVTSNIYYYTQFNGDTSASYARHGLYGDGSAAAAFGGANTNEIMVGYDGGFTQPMSVIVDIHDYASTSKNKTVQAISGNDQNGAGVIALLSGLWRNTSAINSVTVYNGGNNYTTGTVISLYGIVG